MDLDTKEQPKRHMAHPRLDYSLGRFLGQNLPRRRTGKPGATLVPVRVHGWPPADVQGTFKTRTGQEVSDVSSGCSPRPAVGHLDPQFRKPALEGLRNYTVAVNAPRDGGKPDGQGLCLRRSGHEIKGLVHRQNQADPGGKKQPFPRMGPSIQGACAHSLCCRTCPQGPGTPIQSMEAFKARTTSVCARSLLR